MPFTPVRRYIASLLLPVYFWRMDSVCMMRVVNYVFVSLIFSMTSIRDVKPSSVLFMLILYS